MTRAITTRIRKLEAKQPQGFEALTEAELDARIDELGTHLLTQFGSIEALAASFRADQNEMAARQVEEWYARKH